MKLIIILGIIAVAFLVYRSLIIVDAPAETQVEKLEMEEVSMPDTAFKKSIQLAAGIAVLIVLLILAAFLL